MSHERLVRLTGFEPAVYGLKARCHSAWLQTHYFGFKYFRFCFRFILVFLSSFFFIIAAIGIERRDSFGILSHPLRGFAAITFRVWTEYSRQLSYAAEPPGGFEPPYTAYKAVVLPLDDKGLRSRERTRTSGLFSGFLRNPYRTPFGGL